MGFFDKFNAAFQKETERINTSKENSNYKPVKEREQEHYNALNRQSDSDLLKKINNHFISDDDKKIIEGILKERGYEKSENGWYDRKEIGRNLCCILRNTFGSVFNLLFVKGSRYRNLPFIFHKTGLFL